MFYIFYNCENLESVRVESRLSSHLKTIGDYAFNSCKKLTRCELGYALESIGDFAFGFTNLSEVGLGYNIIKLGYSPFVGCENLSSLSLGGYYECTGLTIVERSTKTLIEYLPKATEIPSSVKRLGEYSMGGLSFTSFDIPEGIEQICSYAFYYCENLESLTFPKSLDTVESFAFNSCNKLSIATFKNNYPPHYVVEDIYDWHKIVRDTLYVPKGSKRAYEKAKGWHNTPHIVEYELNDIEEIERELYTCWQ